jgi:hypothetical protein
VSAESDATARVNATRLLAEAATKSGILWIQIPGASTHAVWFVWHDDGDPRSPGPAAYVVSGPGEQHLPWLPAQVNLIFRSKDTGGRLLTVSASAQAIELGSPEWDAAVEVLRPERLNATGDLVQRWRESATIHLLTPFGRPAEQPGTYAGESGAAPVHPGTGTTASWRPWHWRGRPQRRRGTG